MNQKYCKCIKQNNFMKQKKQYFFTEPNLNGVLPIQIYSELHCLSLTKSLIRLMCAKNRKRNAKKPKPEPNAKIYDLLKNELKTVKSEIEKNVKRNRVQEF